MTRQDLERMSREQLIAHAERLGIPRPRVLTQPELIDEIVGRTATSDRDRARARGWLGRARDLLAKVVEKGLHLPEAARVLRQEDKGWPAPPPPLPTVTLAEIYAAQGHFERAISVLDEVLAREPDHREARSLRERFVEQLQRSRSRAGRVEVPPTPAAKEAPAKAAKQATEKTEKKEAPAPPSPRPRTAAVKTAASAEQGAPAAKESAPAEEQGAPAAKESAPKQASPVAKEEAPVARQAALEQGADVEEESAEEATPVEEAAAALPMESLEEPPLPQRYEVDEVVAIAVDPRTVYIYWEVRPTTLAHARAANPDGALCLRVASVTASWEGPVVDTRDLHVDALYGDRFLRDVRPGSNVRVSVGWKSAAGFAPLAVGVEVTAPRAVPVEAVAQDVARWEEEPVAPFAAWRPEPLPPSAAARAEPRAAEPFQPRPAMPVPWARSIGGVGSGVQSAPVDTGVAVWGAPREQVEEREEVVEEGWFIPGGSSELGRGGPGRTRTVRVHRLLPGAPGPMHFGGASELQLGGASESARP